MVEDAIIGLEHGFVLSYVDTFYFEGKMALAAADVCFNMLLLAG